jgi:hypothetical protein
MIIPTIASALFILAASPATTPKDDLPPTLTFGIQNTRKLIEDCHAADPTACYAYLQGAWDTYHFVLDPVGEQDAGGCLPPDINNERLKAVFLAYIEFNPKERSVNAGRDAILALLGEFPCKPGITK